MYLRNGLEVSVNIAPRSSRIREKLIHAVVCITRYFMMEMRIAVTEQTTFPGKIFLKISRCHVSNFIKLYKLPGPSPIRETLSTQFMI